MVPNHKGIASNEKADEWAKLVAETPDKHGVEWLLYQDRYGHVVLCIAGAACSSQADWQSM